jgi:chemotaxis protein methyltransferase CheR
VSKEKLPSIDALTQKLRTGGEKDLHRKVVEAMTTHETYFFRDNHPFETLKTTVFPQIIAKRSKEKKMTIWCAAASTGQEPYSVLMTLLECFPEIFKWDFKFIATDISTEILKRAKFGRYTQVEVNRGLPPYYLRKYFKKIDSEWEVLPELRQMIDFRQMNLIKPWSLMPQADLILLRNVMIYFDTQTKKSILERMRSSLTPEGFLMLGCTESTFNICKDFKQQLFEKTAVYRPN